MKNTRTHFLFTALFLALSSMMALAQAPAAQQAPPKAAAPTNVVKPVVYTTAPKVVVAKLQQGDTDVYDVRGKLTFTVTAANTDDTVAGTVTYTIPDDARQKIAELSGKPLAQVQPSFQQKNVIADFQKGTELTVIHLEIKPMDVSILGVKTHFNRITLDIPGRQGEESRYTKEEMEALFTAWARQITNGKARRGIVARMNRAINGEEEN